MGELGGDRGVDGETADGSVFYSLEDLDETLEVHRLLQDVFHDLVDKWVIRDLNVTLDGLEAGGGLGEDAGHEVFGAGALDLRGDALPLGEAEELQAAAGGPAPAGFEDRGGDGGLFEQLLGGVFGEELEDVGEGEAVLLGEGDVDAVVGGSGLELEVEASAEALAEGEAEGLVDAAAEGSVEDELHAAAIVEEALGDDGGLGWHGSEDGSAGDDVGDELLGSGGADSALIYKPLCGGGYFGLSWRDIARGDVGGAGGDMLAEFAYSVGEGGGALGSFAKPEGEGWGRAVGVFDEDAACGFDTLDAPAAVAEEDDVAGAGVDGEVLVERGDLDAFGLEDDGEERGVGDGATVGNGDHAGSTAGVELVVNAVAEEVGAVTAAAGLDAVAEEVDEVIELGGVGSTEGVEERVLFPRLGAAAGYDLLHQYVGWLRWDLELVELAGAHLADEGGLLEEVVTGGGEEAALGDGSAPVAGSADALHGYRYGAGAADLADEVDVADVDSEFERGSGYEDLDLAVLEALLGVEAEGAGERAVVGGDVLCAEALGEGEGDLLDQAAGVDEDERGAMVLSMGGELVEDLLPHAVVGDGA